MSNGSSFPQSGLPAKTESTRPLVSVIVPTFNSARFLRQALASALDQDYEPVEILAVDDGSTDDTLELLGRESRVTTIPRAHAGVSAARNAGVEAARGALLAFLDSDDYWPAGRLTAAVRYFADHPDVGVLLGRQMLFAEPGAAIPSWVKPEWLTDPQDASNTAVLVARREAFTRVGPFHLGLASGEDTEWLLRARQVGVAIARLPEVVVHKRLHGDNLSVETIEQRKATLARIARESIQRHKQRGAP